MKIQVTQQTGPRLRTISMLWYGKIKCGKTTEAAKLPNAIIFSLEPEGTDYIDNPISVVYPETLASLQEHINWVANQEYKTVVLDGFTHFIGAALRDYAASKSLDPRRAAAVITPQVRLAVEQLLRSGKSVIATGHHRVVDVIDQLDGGNVTKQEIRPDLNDALFTPIVGGFSHISYCYPLGSGKSTMINKPFETDKLRIVAGSRGSILPNRCELSAAEITKHLQKARDKKAAAADAK